MSFSLQSSVRNCSVDSGWADRIASDRFLNPSMMICPTWSGFDSAGRVSCPDSFYTKSIGCNSADDRIFVENALRPKYYEYINLDAAGLNGDGMYNSYTYTDEGERTQSTDNAHKYSGSVGFDYGGNIRANCGMKRYNQVTSMSAPAGPYTDMPSSMSSGGSSCGGRQVIAGIEGYRGFENRYNSGNGFQQAF